MGEKNGRKQESSGTVKDSEKKKNSDFCSQDAYNLILEEKENEFHFK